MVTIENGTTQFNYDCFLRLLAEEQVRWQGKPEDALKMLKARAMNATVKARILASLKKKKTKWRGEGHL